jgi:hypothetical protein
MRNSRASLLTLTLAASCAALATLSPHWRTVLEAQTYYGAARRMTGGGTIGSSNFKHGFELHCDPGDLPNHLEVNWGRNYFRLDTLTSASCSPSIDGNVGPAGFDTYDGAGTGTSNGAAATAEWTFTDAGEPGKNDFAEITITDASGNVVTVSGLLKRGNHEAHGN